MADIGSGAEDGELTRLNVENRTLAIMDNLRFLRALNNECIDLIAIDPPFAANETFTGRPRPPISEEEYAEEKALAESHGVPHDEGIGNTRVKDVWTWDANVHPAWKANIEDDYPKVFSVIQAVEDAATENEAAYICFMAVRLIECHRVLMPTGSIYLHCDDHANSYLRLLMDAVFGAENYRSQIIWKRSSAHSDTRQGRRQHGRISDNLLFYTKSNKWTWNPIYIDYDPEYIENFYKYVERETNRRYRLDNLTAAKPGGNTLYEWRVRRTGDGEWEADLSDEWENPVPGWEYVGVPPYRGRYWAYSKENMREYAEKGRLVYSRTGMPQYKRYLDEMPGVPLQDLWTDINPIQSQSRERTGYATQKPLELYERIIKASSNPGDVVLDIFAGCATTAVAAEKLGRQWIACDMAYRSWTMLKRRFYLNGYALGDMTDATRNALGEHQTELQEAVSRTIGPGELPERDDEDPAPHHDLRPPRRGRRSSAQTAGWSGRIPKDDAKKLLIERFGPVCWGCGYLPRRPNGSLDDTLLEVDHIRALRASEGKQGNDELYNLALLHRTCNGIKRNKLTLEQLREHNELNGLLWVNDKSELIDLYEAVEFANEQIALHVAQHGYAQPAAPTAT